MLSVPSPLLLPTLVYILHMWHFTLFRVTLLSVYYKLITKNVNTISLFFVSFHLDGFHLIRAFTQQHTHTHPLLSLFFIGQSNQTLAKVCIHSLILCINPTTIRYPCHRVYAYTLSLLWVRDKEKCSCLLFLWVKEGCKRWIHCDATNNHIVRIMIYMHSI